MMADRSSPCLESVESEGMLAVELDHVQTDHRPVKAHQSCRRMKIVGGMVTLGAVLMLAISSYTQVIVAPMKPQATKSLTPTYATELFGARECSGCQCDCSWATGGNCAKSAARDCCYMCCCGEEVGVPDSAGVTDPSDGFGFHSEISDLQHLGPPRYPQQPAPQIPYKQTAPHTLHQESLSAPYAESMPSDEFAPTVSDAEPADHTKTVLHVSWVILFIVLLCLTGLGLYMFFAQGK